MYVRRSTLYNKALFLIAEIDLRKQRTVACGISLIKIHCSDYRKRINEVYVYSNKISLYSDIFNENT